MAGPELTEEDIMANDVDPIDALREIRQAEGVAPEDLPQRTDIPSDEVLDQDPEPTQEQDTADEEVVSEGTTTENAKTARAQNSGDESADDEDDTTTTSTKTKELTPNKKQQILRAFVDAVVMVPAVAREQGTTIEEFEFWDELGVNEELFFDVYNASLQFKDRIDSIYSLCEEENYLVNRYIDKLAA